MAPGKRCSNASTALRATSSLPTPPLEDSEDLLPETIGSSGDSSLPKGVRGKALGIRLEKATRGGRKVPLVFPEKKFRPIGDWAAEFNSEVGRLVRTYIDPSLNGWEEVSDVDQKHLEKLILGKFDIDIKLYNVKRGFREMMMTRYRNWRTDLYKHYKKYRPHARSNPPDDVSQDKWERLCLRFSSEKFQKRSQTNIANRGKLKSHHFTGSKSFVRVRYEKRNPETGTELDRIDLFRETYFNSSTGTWSTVQAEKCYNAMIALKSQPTKEGEAPLTSDEICVKVLGKKSGYIRGLGHGEKPAPSSSSSQASRFEVEEANKRVEEAEIRAQQAERRADEAEKRATELGDRVSGVESVLQSMMSRFPPS